MPHSVESDGSGGVIKAGYAEHAMGYLARINSVARSYHWCENESPHSHARWPSG